MIEVLKQALEAFEIAAEGGGVNFHAYAEELRQAIAEAGDNYQGSDAAKAAHMMDLYTALGVRWGDDPFAVIAKMRSIAELESQEPLCTAAMFDDWFLAKSGLDPKTPLYTHPPQRTWVRLTDEDIKTICSENGWDSSWQSLRFAQAIEAKLKQKNGFAEEKNT